MAGTFDKKKHDVQTDRQAQNSVSNTSVASYVFTVIGFWPETMQRFADVFAAADACDAEEKCLREHRGLSVCGVVAGDHECVDPFEFVRTLDA